MTGQRHGRTVSACSVLVDCLFGSEEYRRDPDKGLHSDSRDGRSFHALVADGHAFDTQQARSGGRRMSRISGRVVLKESDRGIPDLLVVLFDVDPGIEPEEHHPASPEDQKLAVLAGDRIGSVLTDRNGDFSLSFDDSEFQRSERRPDIQLAVLAPEGPEEDPETRVLYASTSVRINAGITEQYLVRISGDHLSRAGVASPSVAQEFEPGGD
jgi:hypothetical protein